MSSSRPNALTYGQFSLAMSHVQKFCPYNWTQSSLKKRRQSRKGQNDMRRDKSERLFRRMSGSPFTSTFSISSISNTSSRHDSSSINTESSKSCDDDSELHNKKARRPLRRRVLSMGASSSSVNIFSESPEKELRIWSLTPCDHCGYVPLDYEVLAMWSGWTPPYTSSHVPVLRLGMVVEATRNNNRLMRVIRGVPMKYRKGDLGVVLEVKGPAARIRWNDSVEHESPNWRDCVKIVETPFPGKLFETMRRVEERRSRDGQSRANVSYVVVDVMLKHGISLSLSLSLSLFLSFTHTLYVYTDTQYIKTS
jgi:hypothetical protein